MAPPNIVMYEGNCALKLDTNDILSTSRRVSSDEVNIWLEKNKSAMEKLSIEAPMDWAEACMGG